MAILRNKEIKKLWNLGKTLQSIAEEFNITKQRVHQIVFKTEGESIKVHPKVRKAILKRDNYQCLKCGDKIKSHLTINHIIPRIVGGTNNPKNLETLCYKCNRQAFAELTRKAFKLYFNNTKPDYQIKKIKLDPLIIPGERLRNLRLLKKRMDLIDQLKNEGFSYREMGKMFCLTGDTVRHLKSKNKKYLMNFLNGK